MNLLESLFSPLLASTCIPVGPDALGFILWVGFGDRVGSRVVCSEIDLGLETLERCMPPFIFCWAWGDVVSVVGFIVAMVCFCR